MKSDYFLICTLLLAANISDVEKSYAQQVPQVVKLPAGMHQYRASGEFLKARFPVNAPKITIHFNSPISIMKYQVSSTQYGLCMKAGVCNPPFKNRINKIGKPVTGVSYNDALDYAEWLSEHTEYNWRLPTDEEWAYAAGSRFVDDAIDNQQNPFDPSRNWILKYQAYAELDKNTENKIRKQGYYGQNENGLYDLSGNIWEWTSTCYKRSTINKAGKIEANGTPNCGVRIAEGRHRAYITDFIQDAKGGGCAVGAPPTHLGFRLVRDQSKKNFLHGFNIWWRNLVN